MIDICGIVRRSDEQVDRAALEQMRDVMDHRGPDGSGLFIDGHVGLGHRRLAIIDLATGHQPMTNEDGSCHIVFNGEIYNYLELRDTYLEHSHQFRMRSDTEVILHLYEEFGEACVTYLNGMFAFAIWDALKRQLFMARDRVGVKPLYYTIRGDTFLFASELKALLNHPLVERRIDPTAIDEFLTYGYVQPPKTICEGILRVPEGHVLLWRDGIATLKQYWDLRFEPDTVASEEEHAERVRRGSGVLPAMWALGPHPWSPALNNIMLFVVTGALVFALARRVAGSMSAVGAVAMIAVWPTGFSFRVWRPRSCCWRRFSSAPLGCDWLRSPH